MGAQLGEREILLGPLPPRKQSPNAGLTGRAMRATLVA